MTVSTTEILWRQFGGSIDMLANAIGAWPEQYWAQNMKFYFMAYHTVVFLDYYLTIPPVDFKAKLSYTLKDAAEIPDEGIDDVVPDNIYSKEELLSYVQHCRDKCRNVISNLNEQALFKPWIEETEGLDLSLAGRDPLKYSVLEIILYNMKHVQHHVAQLNLMLRLEWGTAPGYVSHVTDPILRP